MLMLEMGHAEYRPALKRVRSTETGLLPLLAALFFIFVSLHF
jgi:hypothetical protein